MTRYRDSAGIGFAIIQQLVKHGAKVYMGARNPQKASAAIERLHASGIGSEGPDKGQVVWLDLDLSDPRKVQKAAEEVLRREERLDVLSEGFNSAPAWKRLLTGLPRS